MSKEEEIKQSYEYLKNTYDGVDKVEPEIIIKRLLEASNE